MNNKFFFKAFHKFKMAKRTQPKETSPNNDSIYPNQILHKTKRTLLKETFVEFSKRTSVNAYGKIFVYENAFVQITWLLILLASLSLTAYVVASNLLTYLMSTVSQTEIVNETPTEFPAVTFCDNNPFTTKEFPDTDFADPRNEDFEGVKSCIQLGLRLASSPLYDDEYRKKLGLNIERINSINKPFLPDYESCSFNGIDCSNDLHWYWDYDYGNCYQFNVGFNLSKHSIELKKSNRAGSSSGLQVNVVPLTNSQLITSLYPSGMVVFVHNASMRPLKSSGIFIETGKKTFISVRRTFINNVGSAYTQCQDLTTYSSRLYDFIKKSKKYTTYRQQDCFNLCIQELIMSKCNCSYSGFDVPNLKNVSIQPCLTLADYKCYSSKFYEFDPNECAAKSCPLECQSIVYDLSVSSLLDPSFENYQLTSGYEDFCWFYYWQCPMANIFVIHVIAISNALSN